jgi:hypothetical protein
MIGGPGALAVKVLIITGSRHEQAVTYHCQFKPRSDSGTWTNTVSWWFKLAVLCHCRFVTRADSDVEPITASFYFLPSNILFEIPPNYGSID